MSTLAALAEFITSAAVPERAVEVARDAVLDTIGVILAGSVEPAARVVQAVAADEGGTARCRILGTSCRTGAAWAALANATAAHALDYDDMCFLSLAHPSAPLVAAGIATGEMSAASGRAILEAYSIGFEVEAVLGRVMNPGHYQHGWHCTSTIGTIGAAAASARTLGLGFKQTVTALSIAASEASGLKENFGTMVKPLQAGLAARNGVLAVLLARRGLSASATALDGPQGFLVAMSSERMDLGSALDDLGSRWEIIEGGITVKLYPSCAATHPALDALLDLRRRHGFGSDEVEAVEIGVDAITPTVLIYERPTTGLEAKFSMHLCAAAAIARGRVGIDTFQSNVIEDPRVQDLVRRVTMHVDPAVGRSAPPLTQAAVRVRLKDGRTLSAFGAGARGYPSQPASADELDEKFRSCAARALPRPVADEVLTCVRTFERISDIRDVTELLGHGVPARSLA